MRRTIAVAAIAVLCACATLAQDEIVINTELNIDTYRVFGSEHPGLYKHPASITQLANGDLYIAYYGGSGEYDDGTAVYGSRKRPEVPVWTTPAPIANTPSRGDGNPVVWQAPDGRVWLFYVNRYGETWSTSRVKAKVSDDGAETWSDPFMLTFEQGTMVRGKPIALNNGDYLLPMYHETGHDRENVGATTSSYFLRYNPTKNEWTETNRITSDQGNLQPQAAQLSDDHVVCYMRRGGGYGPLEKGYIQFSESKDGGFTWSEGVNTDLPNPNSAVDVVKLENGHLLLVYNDSMNDRTPLTVAVSMDNGKTWPHKRSIGGGDNSFAYPYAIQTQDGMVHIIYTTNSRATIMHAVFDEQAITGPWNE
ncbi:MAG: exo-alpha-sialidase [bacterium]|nr:exo-alpha-sialidase [bacterium]